jgi:glycine/D-amino acid oxidase-like deaminating enzyme
MAQIVMVGAGVVALGTAMLLARDDHQVIMLERDPAGPQIRWRTVSSLTLPADNGTWAVVLVTGSKDTALRSLREPDTWAAVLRGLPLVAHWLDGIPIDDGVQVMARLEDRYRGFVVTDSRSPPAWSRWRTPGRAPIRPTVAARRSACCTR